MRTDLKPPVQARVITSPAGAGYRCSFPPASGGRVSLDITVLADCTVTEVRLLDSSPEPVHFFSVQPYPGRVLRAGETLHLDLGDAATQAVLTAFFDENSRWIADAIAGDGGPV
jgi:hypothetical protein